MSFLTINEAELEYVDVEFIEAMQFIHRHDFSFEPIKDLPAASTTSSDEASVSSTASSSDEQSEPKPQHYERSWVSATTKLFNHKSSFKSAKKYHHDPLDSETVISWGSKRSLGSL